MHARPKHLACHTASPQFGSLPQGSLHSPSRLCGMRALGTSLALSLERPHPVCPCLPHMSSPHVFPTCLPHPDAEAPSSAERRAERRASRRPHRACSRQRPGRVLTTAPLCECSRQRPVVRIAPTASAHDSALVRVLTAAPLDGGVSAMRRARHGGRVTRRRVRHSRSSVADATCCGSRDRCAQGVCERSRSTDCHAAPRRK